MERTQRRTLREYVSFQQIDIHKRDGIGQRY